MFVLKFVEQSYRNMFRRRPLSHEVNTGFLR